MVNVITVLGFLSDIDAKSNNIRFLKTTREYKNNFGDFDEDCLPIMWWSKENKNELFSLNKGSLVFIKGRVEMIHERLVIVAETLTYLGLKK